jgi:hypothetical protein
MDLLEFFESKSECSLANVYTRNETWIHSNEPWSSMCANVDVAKPIHSRPFIGMKKVMIWVYFSRFGIGNIVLLLPKEIFDREFFVEIVLSDFDEERAGNRQRKCYKDISLHLDNTIPHRASQDFDRLEITRFLHPPCSQDLALWDFWLFGTLKKSWKDPLLEIQSKCRPQ